jgi:hypothetical protein
MIRKVRGVLFALLLMAIVLAGCSSSKKPAEVSGKVTYKGEPVTGGMIQFCSVEGNENFQAGITEAGTYVVNGVSQGEMIVTVDTEGLNPNRPKVAYGGGKDGSATSSPDAMAEKMKAMGKLPEGAGAKQGAYVAIPKKYGEKGTSPLKTTVKGGKQVYDAVLTD